MFKLGSTTNIKCWLKLKPSRQTMFKLELIR